VSNPTALEGINEARGQVELGNVEFVGIGGLGGVRIGVVLEFGLVEVAAESFEGFFAEEGGIGCGDSGGEESRSGLEARFEGGPRAVGSEKVVEVGLGVQTLQPNGGSGSGVWPLVEFEGGRLVNGRNAYERSHFWRVRDRVVRVEEMIRGQWFKATSFENECMAFPTSTSLCFFQIYTLHYQIFLHFKIRLILSSSVHEKHGVQKERARYK